MATTRAGHRTLGQLINKLRKDKKWKQRDVVQAMAELEIITSPSSISKVEDGDRAISARWLDKLLKALDADYPTYQEAMEMAGYSPRLIEPTEDEIRRARKKTEDALKKSPYPTYLADCLLRILDWNQPFEAFGPHYAAMLRMSRISMLDMIFGSSEDGPRRGDFMSFVENPEEIYEQQIRILYHDWQLSQEENWYKEMVPRLLRHPLFQRMWEAAEERVVNGFEAREAQYTLRTRIPIRLRTYPEGPEGPIVRLTFYSASYRIPEDARFQLVTFHPADAKTMRWCAQWGAENED